MGKKPESEDFSNLSIQKIYGLVSLSDEEILQLAEKHLLANAIKPFQTKFENITTLLQVAKDKNLLPALMADVPSVDKLDKDILDDIRNQVAIKNYCYYDLVEKSDNLKKWYINHDIIKRNPETTANAVALQTEINTLRHQIKELQQQKFTDEQNLSIKKIEESIDVAAERSADLTANIILPPRSVTDVHLVPTHSLERYAEYKADENIAFLLTGLFAGAAVSVLVNWATSETFKPNVMSTTLIILFLLLTILFSGWIIRINSRIKKVSNIFEDNEKN